MQDRPSAAELVRAVIEHLEREVLPALADPKLRYRTLVAAHVLSVVEREMERGEDAARQELEGLRALQGVLSSDPSPGPVTLTDVEAEVLRRNGALSAAIRSGGEGEPARLI